MAFGNRLISTGGGGNSGGVTGATLLDLDGLGNSWKYGIEHDANYMYNINNVGKQIGVGQWAAEATVSTHSIVGAGALAQGFAACSDGTFLLCNRDQYQVFRYNSSFVKIATYSISGRPHDITALSDGFAISDEDKIILEYTIIMVLLLVLL